MSVNTTPFRSPSQHLFQRNHSGAVPRSAAVAALPLPLPAHAPQVSTSDRDNGAQVDI